MECPAVEKIDGESFVRLGIRDREKGVEIILRNEGNYEEFTEIVGESREVTDFDEILWGLLKGDFGQEFMQLLIYLRGYFQDGEFEKLRNQAIIPVVADDEQRLDLTAWLPQIDYRCTVEALKRGFSSTRIGPDYEAQALFFALLKLLLVKHPEAPDLFLIFLKSNWGYKASTLKGFYERVELAVEYVLKEYRSLPSNQKHFFRTWLYRRYRFKILSKDIWTIALRPLFGSLLGAFVILSGVFIESAKDMRDFFFCHVTQKPFLCLVLFILSLVLTFFVTWLEIHSRVTEKQQRRKRAWRVSLILASISALISGILIFVLIYLGLSLDLSHGIEMYFLLWALVLLGGVLSQLIWEDKAFVEQLQSP